MDPKNLLLISTLVANTLLGVFIYFRGKKSKVSFAFILSIITVILWTVTMLFYRQSRNSHEAVLWCRFLYLSAALIPYTFLYFTFLFPEENFSANYKKKLLISVPPIIISILCLMPKMVINSVALKSSQENIIKFGMLYPIYAIYIMSYFSWSFTNLYRKFKSSTNGRLRMQIKYIAAGVMTSSCLAFITNLFLPWFGIFSLNWLGQILTVIYAGMTAYAIVKYRLMDINIAIKNTIIYAALYSSSVGLFVVTVVFIGQLLFYGPSALDSRVLWMGIFALLFVVAIVRPLDKLLTKITDKYLFQSKYEYRKTLREAAKGMSRITSMHKLFKLIVHFISMRVRVAHAEIFYIDNAKSKYLLQARRGKDKTHSITKLSKNSALAAWLEEKKDVLNSDEVGQWLNDESKYPGKKVLRKTLEDIKIEMEKLNATIVVPCFRKNSMLGFLILGNKLSGDIYTKEDSDVLLTLSHEVAVALENALLYEQLYDQMAKIKQLYEKEKKIFISTAFAFAAAIDAKDTYTHGHTERVTRYCLEIGNELKELKKVKIPADFDDTLHISALLHDVGKIGTPDHILNKKGPLTKEEYDEIKLHPIIGASILHPISELGDAATAIRHHQERWDGKGYPDGLKQSAIPLYSRVIMVADAFDAMISDRPYRQRVMEEVAIQEIQQGAGTQFDPDVVEAFIGAYQKGKIVVLPEKPKPQKNEKKYAKHPMSLYVDPPAKEYKKHNDLNDIKTA